MKESIQPTQEDGVISYETDNNGILSYDEVVLLAPYDFPADGILINKAHFPDPVFRAWVSEHCDTDDPKDSFLSPAEIASVDSIDVSGSWSIPGTIASLEGIKYFT